MREIRTSFQINLGSAYPCGNYFFSDYNFDRDDKDDKKKRTRTAFSTDQIKSLEKRFVSNHYVVGAERQKLANELDLSEAQVKVESFAYKTVFPSMLVSCIDANYQYCLSIIDHSAPALEIIYSAPALEITFDVRV